MTSKHPEFETEQKHISSCYEYLESRLDRLQGKAHAATQKDAVDLYQSKKEQRSELAELLSSSANPLVLGRCDFLQDHDRWPGERYYIARRLVEGDGLEPLAISWKSEPASAWYQATPNSGPGLQLKRTFNCDGRDLIDIDDIWYADVPGTEEGEAPQFSDSLLRELEREATGQMQDIVATIQADQDRLIREPMEGILVIQGGPGTGKTAVGLHRLAVLLFREEHLNENDVLVVGPNDIFLQFIADVLPSLGASAVAHTSITALGPPVPITTHDSERTRVVKGRAVMADVLRRFLDDRITEPTEDLNFAEGELSLPLQRAREIVQQLRASERPYAVRRDDLRHRLLSALADESDRSREAVESLVGTDTGFENALNRIWPSLSAPEAVRRLLQGRQVLEAAAADLLAADEQQLLLRPRTERLEDAVWSVDDRPLLDEMEFLLNGRRGTEKYAHIVVDEAQDLSPMQFRALLRRCPEGSMTLLGDLAQAAAPWEPERWEEILDAATPDEVRVEHLFMGYRARQPILEFANRLLPAIGVDVDAPQSARREGDEPRLVEVSEHGELAEQLGARVVELQEESGTIGVIGTPEDLAVAAEGLDSAGITYGLAEQHGLKERVTLVDAAGSHGIEFDHVVVLEPDHIRKSTKAGLRLLYVALTRARESLTVMHSAGLLRVLRPDVTVPVIPTHEQSSSPETTGVDGPSAQGTSEVIYVEGTTGTWRAEATAVNGGRRRISLEQVPVGGGPVRVASVEVVPHGDHVHAVWVCGAHCGELEVEDVTVEGIAQAIVTTSSLLGDQRP